MNGFEQTANVLLLASLIVFGLISANFLLFWWVSRRVRSFFNGRGDKPSDFATLSDFLIDRNAEKIALLVKTSFLGKMSGEARAEKAVEKAIATDLINEKQPLIAMALKAFPTLAKLVDGNPGLAMAAMAKLSAKKLEGNGSQGSEPIDMTSF